MAGCFGPGYLDSPSQNFTLTRVRKPVYGGGDRGSEGRLPAWGHIAAPGRAGVSHKFSSMIPLLQDDGGGGGQWIPIRLWSHHSVLLSVLGEFLTSLGPSWHTCETGIRISPFPGCGDRVTYGVYRQPLGQGGNKYIQRHYLCPCGTYLVLTLERPQEAFL